MASLELCCLFDYLFLAELSHTRLCFMALRYMSAHFAMFRHVSPCCFARYTLYSIGHDASCRPSTAPSVSQSCKPTSSTQLREQPLLLVLPRAGMVPLTLIIVPRLSVSMAMYLSLCLPILSVLILPLRVMLLHLHILIPFFISFLLHLLFLLLSYYTRRISAYGVVKGTSEALVLDL